VLQLGDLIVPVLPSFMSVDKAACAINTLPKAWSKLCKSSGVDMALQSQLLGSSVDLNGVAVGTRTIRAPEVSDSVALVQQALVAIEASLPDSGVDGSFGDETGQAVSAYKSSRGLVPDDPVVGPGTTASLDVECAYLEGSSTDAAISDTRILALDPMFAGT
jgi:peptidoglycan hydrolase-like protein with peptidoglycan-binding domain